MTTKATRAVLDAERPMTPERMAQTPVEAGVEAPAPSQWTPGEDEPSVQDEADTPLPGEARKVKWFKTLTMKPALDAMKRLAEDIPDLEMEAAQKKYALMLSEQAVADRESVVRGTIEGKNAEERKAALDVALTKDEEYQGAIRASYEARREMWSADAMAERAKRQWVVWSREIEARASQLRLLAGV